MTASAMTTPAPERKMLLDRSFMGTDLTLGGAVITIAVAPVVWFLIILVWAALPA